MQRIILAVMVLWQSFVSLFYASAAVAMWVPFIEGLPLMQLLVAAIVLLPVLSFLVACDRIRIPRVGALAVTGVMTTIQLALVLALVTIESGAN